MANTSVGKKIRACALVLVVFGCTEANAIEYPNLDVTGFVRLQPALSIGGKNPNNRNIDDSARDLNLFRTWAQLELIGNVSRSWRWYGKFRLIGESAADLDGRVSAFDAFPNRFRGNGWMARVANDHVSFEAWELYTDVTAGDFWLRLGKQQIVWGETLGRRLLDVVNPLDLSWHLFLGPFVEEFDNTRVPQWFARAAYAVPNPWISGLTLEAVVNPGDAVPTLLPDQGSPYSVTPSFVTLDDRAARGHWIAGSRLFGSLSEVSLSLVYLTKPTDEALALSTGAVPDERLGVPTPVAPGVVVPLRFLARGIHPRFHLIGGSASYYAQRLGTVLRLETTYAPDQPYQKAPPPAAPITSITRQDTARYAISIERPSHLLPGHDPATILSATFFQSVVIGRYRHLRDRNAEVDATTEQLALALSQPFYRKQIFADLFWIYDFDDAWWLQPGLRYIHGNHWRYDVFANILGGTEKRPGRFGASGFVDEVVWRVTYGF